MTTRKLEGRRAIVSGGARGIGAAIAAAFVAEGATVVIVDTLAGQGESVARSLGAQVRFVSGDVTLPATWQRLVDELGPHLEVLVNNAGGMRHPQPLHEIELDE